VCQKGTPKPKQQPAEQETQGDHTPKVVLDYKRDEKAIEPHPVVHQGGTSGAEEPGEKRYDDLGDSQNPIKARRKGINRQR
jgi:hypothetical protein